MNETPHHKPEKKDTSGCFVLLCLLGFFAVFASVDAFFVYMAVSSHTGTIIEKSYEQGLEYNALLGEARDQKQLGLNTDVTFENGVITLKAQDKANRPLTDAIIVAKIIRPSHDGYDFTVPLSHVKNGTYIAQPKFPLNGQWHIQLDIKWHEKNHTGTDITTLPRLYQKSMTVNIKS